MCVRLTKELAEKIDSYVCNACKQMNSSSIAGGIAGATTVGGGGGRGGASGGSVALLSALKRSLLSSERDPSTTHGQSHLQT